MYVLKKRHSTDKFSVKTETLNKSESSPQDQNDAATLTKRELGQVDTTKAKAKSKPTATEAKCCVEQRSSPPSTYEKIKTTVAEETSWKLPSMACGTDSQMKTFNRLIL